MSASHSRKTVELTVSWGNIAEGFLSSFAEHLIDGYNEQIRKTSNNSALPQRRDLLVFSELQPETRLESKDNLIH